MAIGRLDKKGPHRVAFERNKKRILKTKHICGICGHDVDKTLAYPHPLSPVIDHIIPVNGPGGIKGHPSDLSNLQLSHMACNRAKSNKMFENPSEPKVLGNRNLPHSMDWTTYRV